MDEWRAVVDDMPYDRAAFLDVLHAVVTVNYCRSKWLLFWLPEDHPDVQEAVSMFIMQRAVFNQVGPRVKHDWSAGQEGISSGSC